MEAAIAGQAQARPGVAQAIPLGTEQPAAGTEATEIGAGAILPHEVASAVEKINQTVQVQNAQLEFSVDDATKMNVVKVVDRESNHVIRQIPSKEVLAIAQALDRLQGLLIRDQA
jgi:flagellar protein FlaG